MKMSSVTPLVVLGVALAGVSVLGQARGGTPQTDKVTPVNTGANPYRVIRDWAHIDGRAWGGSNGVAISPDDGTMAISEYSANRMLYYSFQNGPNPACTRCVKDPSHTTFFFDTAGRSVRRQILRDRRRS